MDAIRIDAGMGKFLPDVITNTAHHYTDEFFVEIALSHPPPCRVAYTPKHVDRDISRLALPFGSDLADERLRAHHREETSDLQTTLVQATLREASLRDPKVLL